MCELGVVGRDFGSGNVEMADKSFSVGQTEIIISKTSYRAVILTFFKEEFEALPTSFR